MQQNDCPADVLGSREQTVWFRYQQIECAGSRMAPPCKMIGPPQCVALRSLRVAHLAYVQVANIPIAAHSQDTSLTMRGGWTAFFKRLIC